MLLTVSGTEASGSTYEDTSTATTPAFTGVTTGAAGTKLVDITYANGGSSARKATIQVNGQYKYQASFPPTGSATTYRTVSVLAHMAKGTNTVTFAAVSGSTAPDIDAIRVQGVPGTNGVALTGAASNRCLGFEKNTVAGGSQAILWDCFGGRNEIFAQTSRGELVVYGNKCLDADNNGTANGTKVILLDCTNGTNQKVDRQLQRQHHQQPVGPLPGRRRSRDREWHQGDPVDLQRPDQPEVDAPLTSATVSQPSWQS